MAVGSVLLFHAGIPGLDGGFVGVDVFFVVSGFLITGVLLREVEQTGRVNLLDFYARRLKRLAPVYLLVLAVTLLTMLLALPPLYTSRFGPHLLGTLLYVANFVLAGDIQGYFADAAPSPVLHFWSLAVEEQFYLLWPLLVLLVSRGRVTRARRRVAMALLPVVLGSFALAVVLTPRFPTPSYYLLHTRSWELGVGALLACLPALGARLDMRARTRLLMAGGLSILASVVLLDASTVFPGWAAVPSVLGAGAMLVAGQHGTTPLSRVVLENRFMVWLGDISYSLYLWHWPILVLPAAIHGSQLPLAARLALAGIAVLVAWASHVLVEDPLQRMSLQGRRRAIYLTSAATTLVLTLVTAGATVHADRGLSGQSSSVRIPALDRRLAAVPAPIRADYANESVTAAGRLVTPTRMTPPINKLEHDLTEVQTNGCSGDVNALQNEACWGGDRAAERTLVLLGDSHASQWWHAWDAIGRQEHYRVLALVGNSCPAADPGEIPSDRDEESAAECDAFRQAARRSLAEVEPEVVVVAQTITQYQVLSPNPAGFHQRWQRGMVDLLGAIPAASRILYLGDNPSYSPKISDLPAAGNCLSEHATDAQNCLVPHRIAEVAQAERTSQRLVADTGGRYADLSTILCLHQGCPMVTRNHVLYRDHTHVTSATSRILAPVLADELARTPGRAKN